jgi:hypothetical protein
LFRTSNKRTLDRLCVNRVANWKQPGEILFIGGVEENVGGEKPPKNKLEMKMGLHSPAVSPTETGTCTSADCFIASNSAMQAAERMAFPITFGDSQSYPRRFSRVKLISNPVA